MKFQKKQGKNFVLIYLDQGLALLMFGPNFGEYFDLVLLFKKKLPLHELFVYEPMMNFPEVFASTPNQIPIFWANIFLSVNQNAGTYLK